MLIVEMRNRGIRVHEVQTDLMEPTFRRGDFLLVKPVTAYDHDGVYLLAEGDEIVVWRAQSIGQGRVEIWHDAPGSLRYLISRDEFSEAVIGKAAGVLTLFDKRLLESLS